MKSLEKLQSIGQLPIFPLAIVLLPGMVLPLHIFEPRYRKMLHDCLDSNRLFGLTYHPESAVGTSVVPVEGSIGCAAHITSVVPLPEEQSNILTTGLCRYTTQEYLSQDPYLVARIEFFQDDPADPVLSEPLVEDVSGLFMRFAESLRILRDAPAARLSLPEDVESLSFAIASVVLIDLEDQLAVLQMRSTTERLEFLREHLGSIIEEFEARAREHVAMRGNGKGRAGSIFH
jgi:Lon protease-like protein